MPTPDEWAAQFAAAKPGPERKALYELYIGSAEWRAKRTAALSRAGGKCQLGANHSGQLHVHHRTYERCGNEALDDLTVLCKRCHSVFHDQVDIRGPKQRKAQPKKKAAKPKRIKRSAKLAGQVAEKVAEQPRGQQFTTGSIANKLKLRKCDKRTVRGLLAGMVERGELRQISTNRFVRSSDLPEPRSLTKRDVTVLTEQLKERSSQRADSVRLVAMFLRSSPALTPDEIAAGTNLSMAHVNAAIGSLNYRREIEPVEGKPKRWKATDKLALVA